MRRVIGVVGVLVLLGFVVAALLAGAGIAAWNAWLAGVTVTIDGETVRLVAVDGDAIVPTLALAAVAVFALLLVVGLALFAALAIAIVTSAATFVVIAAPLLLAGWLIWRGTRGPASPTVTA